MRTGCRQTLVLGMVANQCLYSGDWPQWRGPNRTGVSQETGLLKQWPKSGPKLLWHISDIGDGYGTVAIAGQRIYLQSNKGMENEFVQALSVTDGKPIWTTRLGNVGNPNQQPPYPMARSTPTIDGDRLYAFSSDGVSRAFRPYPASWYGRRTSAATSAEFRGPGPTPSHP